MCFATCRDYRPPTQFAYFSRRWSSENAWLPISVCHSHPTPPTLLRSSVTSGPGQAALTQQPYEASTTAIPISQLRKRSDFLLLAFFFGGGVGAGGDTKSIKPYSAGLTSRFPTLRGYGKWGKCSRKDKTASRLS